MWEQLYNILLNPNHEMPSITMILVIAVIVIVANAYGRYSLDKRDEKRRGEMHSSSKKKK